MKNSTKYNYTQPEIGLCVTEVEQGIAVSEMPLIFDNTTGIGAGEFEENAWN